MPHGLTTSVRLPPKLRDQLDTASLDLRRGKNWIIVQALHEYLNRLNQHRLAEEARKQSILASKQDLNETWEQDTDTSGWI